MDVYSTSFKNSTFYITANFIFLWGFFWLNLNIRNKYQQVTFFGLNYYKALIYIYV